MNTNGRVAIIMAALLFIFLYCTLTTPPRLQVPDVYVHPIPNGCLVYAAAFQASLNARAFLDDRCYWSEVAAVKFANATMYHAVLIFEYNDGTWIYDCNQGAYEVSSKRLCNLAEILDLAYPDSDIEAFNWLRSDLDHHDNYGWPEK